MALDFTQIIGENYAQVRPYYKSELAELYHISKKTLIERWINQSHAEFYNRLIQFGYKLSQRQFTQKQIEIIFEHFGFPDGKKPFIQRTTERIPIMPYSKSELAGFYYWETRTFMSYLKKTMPEDDFQLIFTKNDAYDDNIPDDYKKILSAEEVKQVFFWLGHPFIRRKFTK